MAVTVNLPGVLPLAGVKVSQLAGGGTAATVYATVAPLAAVTLRVKEAGAAEFDSVNEVLPLTVMVGGGLVTVRVTLTVCDVNPDAASVMAPL